MRADESTVSKGEKPATMLLDTNVWVDQFLGVRPHSGASRALVDLMGELAITPLYSIGSSKDAYYTIRATCKRQMRSENDGVLTEGQAVVANEIAWACLENMVELGTAVGCDETDVWLARKQRAVHSDFEDDLVIAAAMRSGALLVTNNEELLRHCPVAAMDAHDATLYLQSIA